MKVARWIILLLLLGMLGYMIAIRPHPRTDGAIEASGSIEATQVDVAPKVTGRLTELRVREGDVVTTGQKLAQLDTVELGEQVRQASASLDNARHKVLEAQASLRLQRDQYRAALNRPGPPSIPAIRTCMRAAKPCSSLVATCGLKPIRRWPR